MTANTPLIRKLIAGTVLAAALTAPLSIAAAASELVGTTVGKTAEEVKANLAAQGYYPGDVTSGDGMLLAYVLEDGECYEVGVDTTTGAVVEVESQGRVLIIHPGRRARHKPSA